MKLSPEERKERKREYNKRYRQNMTKEQKEKLKEYDKRRYQNRTEEQKEETKEKRKEYYERNRGDRPRRIVLLQMELEKSIA